MIDFHCHLDLYPDPHAVLARAEAANVGLVSMTTTPTAWTGTSRLAVGHAGVRTAAGLHPELAHRRRAELPQLLALIGQTHLVGEVGLDGQTRSSEDRAGQAVVLDAVLATAAHHGDRILSLHSRRAVTPVLDRLEQHQQRVTPVLHWFSGTERELARAIDLGCWFSVNEQMLRSTKGRNLTTQMPPGRVLLETDGPFASDGTDPLEPAGLRRMPAILAELWGIRPAEAIELIEIAEQALLR